jgi:hypothetical protein
VRTVEGGLEAAMPFGAEPVVEDVDRSVELFGIDLERFGDFLEELDVDDLFAFEIGNGAPRSGRWPAASARSPYDQPRSARAVEMRDRIVSDIWAPCRMSSRTE